MENNVNGWPNFKCGDEAMLSLVPDNQKIDGKPKVRALRKLITDLIGNIVKEKTVTEHFQFVDAGFAAVVSHRITVEVRNPNFLKSTLTVDGSLATLEASAVADAHPWNINEDFAKFPVACADTRAKGRAYINMLGLNICSAEEMPGKNENLLAGSNGKSYNSNSDDKPASNQHRITINKTLEKLFKDKNISLDVSLIAKHLNIDYEKITESEVSKMNAKIRKWINGEKIPDVLLGSN